MAEDNSQDHASHLAAILREADDDVLREIGEDPEDHRGDDDE